jgi:DNA-directed RNA polymerase beta' subunit
LKESRGEVLKPETINYRTRQSVMVFSVKIFGPVKILNVLVENTKESDTRSFVTVVVLKLLRKKVRVETE